MSLERLGHYCSPPRLALRYDLSNESEVLQPFLSVDVALGPIGKSTVGCTFESRVLTSSLPNHQ